MTTGTQVQLRRGTEAEVASFTGAAGEVTPDMTNNRLVLHDGATVGGHPQASEAFVADAIAAAVEDAGVASLNGKTGAVLAYFPPQGRLTLTSGSPVMMTSASAQTTVYYTPFVGNMIPIYDGSNMVPMPFAELSAATADTNHSPAAIGANKVNDWFVWNDGGALRLSHGPDWASDTTRSAGTNLTLVNGIWLNNADIANGPTALRGTYVGTTRSNGTSSIDWTFGSVASGGGRAVFFVWNAYNRVPVATMVGDSTASWQYDVATTWRAPNSNSNMRVHVVRGFNIDGARAEYAATAQCGSSTKVSVGIGLNSTSELAAGATTAMANHPTGELTTLTAKFSGLIGAGYSYLSALERNSTTTASTWYGYSASPENIQSGLHLELWQ